VALRKAGVPNKTAARRLTAILAADVAGYNRLMGEDEAGTAWAVREHREAARPIVTDHGGRIVKTTGDGLLLEFPSVVAAVECAMAIQKLMVERNAGRPEAKRIVYRIGVNLGDVLFRVAECAERLRKRPANNSIQKTAPNDGFPTAAKPAIEILYVRLTSIRDIGSTSQLRK
jgi:class 3 adenylate cyclase